MGSIQQLCCLLSSRPSSFKNKTKQNLIHTKLFQNLYTKQLLHCTYDNNCTNLPASQLCRRWCCTVPTELYYSVQAAAAQHQTRRPISSGNPSLTVLEAGSQGAIAVRFWWGPCSGLQTADFSFCPHIGKKARELSRAPSIRALIPLVGAPLSWPYYLPTLISSYHHIGVRIPTYAFRGDSNIQSLACTQQEAT